MELLCAVEQNPFDWEPEVRAWLLKPAGLLGACMWVCVGLFLLACICVLSMCLLAFVVCASLRVRETPADNVTGKSQTVFVANWCHMTAQHVHTLFIHSVNYSIWLVLMCDVLARHWEEQLAHSQDWLYSLLLFLLLSHSKWWLNAEFNKITFLTFDQTVSTR